MRKLWKGRGKMRGRVKRGNSRDGKAGNGKNNEEEKRKGMKGTMREMEGKIRGNGRDNEGQWKGQ